MRKCIKCGKDSTRRISPDLDIEGLAVCASCSEEVHKDFQLAMLDSDMLDLFDKKYKLK